jgi:hypothetical protein
MGVVLTLSSAPSRKGVRKGGGTAPHIRNHDMLVRCVRQLHSPVALTPHKSNPTH